MDGDRHRQAGEDEIGGEEQGEADAFAAPERADDQQLDRFERIFPDQPDHEAGNEERQG